MTIAYIKSNTLRRTLIVVLLPLLPIIFGAIASVKAADAFIEELKDQTFGGISGLWDALKSCWNGEDVDRHEKYVAEMTKDTHVRGDSSNDRGQTMAPQAPTQGEPS